MVPSRRCEMWALVLLAQGCGAEISNARDLLMSVQLCADRASAKAIRRGSSAHQRACGPCGGSGSCRFDSSAFGAELKLCLLSRLWLLTIRD